MLATEEGVAAFEEDCLGEFFDRIVDVLMDRIFEAASELMEAKAAALALACKGYMKDVDWEMDRGRIVPLGNDCAIALLEHELKAVLTA